MTPMVVDSSSLILLAKCSLLEVICSVFDVIVPTAAAAEVVSDDLVKKYPDAALISDLMSKRIITVQSPESTGLPIPMSLHKGEREALLLARKLARPLIATDDGKAIKAARFLKIPFVIAPKIVVELFRLQMIPFKKARASLEKLGRIGRYSPEIIADALISLMEEKDGKTDNHKDT